MKLAEYIELENLALSEFAARIGVTHEAVRRYVRCKRVPTPAIIKKIVKATNGKVRPDDFYVIGEAAE